MKAKEYFKIYGPEINSCMVQGDTEGATRAIIDMTDHMHEDMTLDHQEAVEAFEGDEAAKLEFAQKKYVKVLRSYNQKWNTIRSMMRKEFGQPFIKFDGFVTTVLSYLNKMKEAEG